MGVLPASRRGEPQPVEQSPDHQRPAVGGHEHEQLERQRHQARRQHHQAAGDREHGDEQVDHQERQQHADADAERGLELAIEKAGIEIEPVDISDLFAVEVDFQADLDRANQNFN